jgi:quinoprotein glucose dehydrogenase
MEGAGGSVGPDLTQVWDTLSLENRLESILEPSKEIQGGLRDIHSRHQGGRVITGLLLSETPEGVTFKDAQGWEARISAKEIEEKGPDKTSLMPVGVVGNFSFNERADLLSFLGDRKAQEILRSEKRSGEAGRSGGTPIRLPTISGRVNRRPRRGCLNKRNRSHADAERTVR